MNASPLDHNPLDEGLQWTTFCDNSGPNCPQLAVDADGWVHLRDNARPDEVARFDPAAWQLLVANMHTMS